ncbi:acyl carrier protein [Rufibacter radiotolerans]|uniref:Acyl carrier protein n=1 Tax=Rufibacter radiotolerans TaxID=1379910 RepID=A0A0H4VH55_9BACT|nr:phosphopantetheine-binding protein [Rufibacter radiotolerans]AKQ45010.1 acyl carrier protein [Rufibacter radiotolerans]
MVTATAPSIAQKVVHIISRIKRIQPNRLRVTSQLHKELGFDTADVVDIILALEKRFKIVIPDEVPLNTVGDFVEYVSIHSKN